MRRFYNRLFVALTVTAVSFAAGQDPPAASSDKNLARQHFETGNRLRIHHHWQDALRECEEALRLQPAYVDALLCRARTLGQQDKLDAAHDQLAELLRIAPNHADAHVGMGWVLANKGDIDAAFKEFQEALLLDAKNARAHEDMGWALYRKRDPAGSKREYEEAARLLRAEIRANPKDPNPHAVLAEILARTAGSERAIQEYREAIRLDPEDGDSHSSIGDLLLARHDFAGAIREYEAAVPLEPEDPSPHEGLGWAYLQTGKPEYAAREGAIAIGLRPTSGTGHYLIGKAAERKGDRAGALAEYRRALESDPTNEDLRDDYSRVRSEVAFLPAGWSASTVHAFTLTFAFVPSVLLFGYFRGRDLYPEPAKVLWITFGLGVLICWPVLWIDRPLAQIVHQYQGLFSHAAAKAFFNAALPEELMKFAVLFLYCARNKEFDEPMDGIVYGVVASLGFATYENFLYVSNYGIGVAITRAVMSVPGHACMGAVMGYFAGQWKFGPAHHRGRNLILAYVAPVALHWLYDFPLMAHEGAANLTGKARELALQQVAPLENIPVLVLIAEAAVAVLLVNRMHQQQIRMTREIAAAAAAAGGASDLVALINAPDPKPSRAGWFLAVLGGIVSLFGGLLTFGMTAVMRHDWATLSGKDVLTGSLIGTIPLLLGLMTFTIGVRKIHAARHAAAPVRAMVAAAAAAGA